MKPKGPVRSLEEALTMPIPTTNSKAIKQPSHQVSCVIPERKPRTPRKKTIPHKLQQYVVVTAPSGICPKCQKYVKESDNGVACEKCQAFWHYSCVGVSQKELDDDWSGKPFLCHDHRDVRPPNETETVHKTEILSKNDFLTF